MTPGRTVWTVGHSNHDLDVFLALVRGAGLQAVADVRSDPDRVYREHFKSAPLEAALRRMGISYRWFGQELGGRPRSPGHFDTEGRARYDLMAEQPPFGRALEAVQQVAQTHRVALLCSEADPTECHRRLLVGRALVQTGVRLLHLRADGTVHEESELVDAESGQSGLFDDLEVRPWRSAHSVPPSAAPSPSSEP